ncbi:Neuroblastoma-amplified sequence, partial [Armadillidium nasatum]
VEDYEVASNWCLQLVKGCYGEGWEVCAKIGKCDRVVDSSLKARLLDFALTHAFPEYLESLLKASLKVKRVAKITEDPSPELLTPVESSSKPLLFSMTKNVLSATAASTSSLVSSVASKRMWKNAVGWLRPLRKSLSRSIKRDTIEKVGNFEFNKQGCHAFYSDILPEAHISSLGPSYKSYAPTTFTNPALEVSFTLLRIALMEESLYQGNSVQTNSTGKRYFLSYRKVIKGVLQEDLLLGVSFLILLNSPQDVYQVYSSLPRTEISLQVFLYYYALQIYTYLCPWEKPGIAPIFLHSPENVISCVRKIISKEINIKDEYILHYVDYFHQTDQMVTDYMQVQALLRLETGIDIERFLSEVEYKKDTVLGLAMTSDTETLDLAISLAEKYDVSMWELYMSHLRFLFDSPNIDCNELDRIVSERNIVSHLKSRYEDFLTTMEEVILYSIDGRDHDKLSFYFNLIKNTSEDEVTKKNAASHVNYLKQIKDVAPNLDYKTLLIPNSNALEILRPELNSANVEMLANFAQNMPQQECVLDPSTVYCAWAQKHFFETSGKKRPKTVNEWIKRFDETTSILKKLKPKDVNLFIGSFVLTEEGVSKVPLEARKEIIKKAAKYCKRKVDETEDESESKNWMDVFLRFDKLEKHLELLRSNVFKNLQSSSDPVLQRYAHEFMLSGGDEDALKSLSKKVLNELCSMDVLRSVLSVYPEEVSQIPEDIFQEVLRQTLSNLQNLQTSKKDEEVERLCRIFLHLLKELKKYCEEGGDLLDSEDVLDEVRNFAQDNTISVIIRVKIMSYAHQFLPLNEKDLQLFQSMKTGNIVTEAFMSPSKANRSKGNSQLSSVPSNIDTEEGRLELFENLLEKMDSVKKAESIIELLSIWPKFHSNIYVDVETNPFLRVFVKLINHPKIKDEKLYLDLILSCTIRAVNESQMNEECIHVLVEKLIELPKNENLKYAFKISLNSSQHSARQKVIERYLNLPKILPECFDEELIELIIEKEAVVDILPTCLYGPVVSYLSDERNITKCKLVVDQLEVSNHGIEAASLAMRSWSSSSLPRGFKTASSVIKSFRRWF